MASVHKVAYLEDVQHVASISSSQETNPDESSSAKVATGVKRQRTIEDMFGGSASSSKTPPAKKSKVSAAFTSRVAVTKSSGVQSLNSIPFSLSGFKESLSDEEKKLLKLECEAMGKSWLKVLKEEIRKPYFIELKRFLWKEGVYSVEDTPLPLKVYPHPKDIYAWSKYTPLGKVKVVIIGQDPYHGTGQAHGLCFSVPKGVTPPPSLRNIYAEIKKEFPDFVPPKHGNLTGWAENGVLLLNACLTVRSNAAASHSKRGWEEFTDKVVDVLDKYGGANLPTTGSGSSSGVGRGLVWLAWGAFAAKRVARLDKKKHLILTSAHPSPLSAHRGFLGNGHFAAANAWLEERYGVEGKVDWCHLPLETATSAE